MAAVASRGDPGGSLYRGASDAGDGASGSGSWPEAEDDDPRRVRGTSAGSGAAGLYRNTSEPAVGIGSDVRRHLAGIRLCGLRDRRVFEAHRGLAGIEHASSRSGSRRAGTSDLGTPGPRCRALGASQRSRRSVSFDTLYRAACRGGNRTVCGECGGLLRQRAGRVGDRSVQDRDHSPTGTVALLRGCGVRHPRMGRLVQQPSLARADRICSPRRA